MAGFEPISGFFSPGRRSPRAWLFGAAAGVVLLAALAYVAAASPSSAQEADAASLGDRTARPLAQGDAGGPDGVRADDDAAPHGRRSAAARDTTPSIPLNTWVVVDIDEARDLVPFEVLVPERIPAGFSEDVTVAVRVLDVSGNGRADLHSVALTLQPVVGPRDEAGHGNVQINLSEAPPRLPRMITDRPGIDVGRPVEAYGASDGRTSTAAWVEGDLLVQLSGELDEDQLRELTGGMRER